MNMLFCGVVESYQDGNASSAERSYEHSIQGERTATERGTGSARKVDTT